MALRSQQHNIRSAYPQRITHAGELPGVSSRLSVYPDTGLIVVILVNINGKLWFNKIIENHLADRALGLDPIDWGKR